MTQITVNEIRPIDHEMVVKLQKWVLAMRDYYFHIIFIIHFEEKYSFFDIKSDSFKIAMDLCKNLMEQ